MFDHCAPIATALDPLTGSTEDERVIDFDFSNVEPLQRIAKEKRAELTSQWKDKLITWSEWREGAGRPPLPDSVASRLIYLDNQVVIGETADTEQIPDLPTIASLGQGGGGGGGGAVEGDPAADAADTATATMGDLFRQFSNQQWPCQSDLGPL